MLLVFKCNNIDAVLGIVFFITLLNATVLITVTSTAVVFKQFQRQADYGETTCHSDDLVLYQATRNIIQCLLLCANEMTCYTVLYAGHQCSGCGDFYDGTSSDVFVQGAAHYHRIFDCPSGNGLEWISLSSSKIQIQTQSKTQAEAAIACGTAGAKLVKIDEKWKMALLAKLLRECEEFVGDFWVDGSNANATDYFSADAWRFSDESLVSMERQYWNDLAPNNAGDHHCFRMRNPEYRFDDFSCDNKFEGFICEKQIVY